MQRHSGPQERVDLGFEFPSLEPPGGTPRHVNAETVEDAQDAIKRIFLTIAEHHGAMSPETRLQTIYPRYLAPTQSAVVDGLTLQAFRDGTPYEHEDLLLTQGQDKQLVARCTRDRETPVNRFQAREVPLFLISLKAGGTGLNLTAADTVIHYDPWWNPAVERQATDRAHRIGQDQHVFVYKLIAENTVEEKMLELQERKAALADSLFDESGSTALTFDLAELDRLFSA